MSKDKRNTPDYDDLAKAAYDEGFAEGARETRNGVSTSVKTFNPHLDGIVFYEGYIAGKLAPVE